MQIWSCFASSHAATTNAARAMSEPLVSNTFINAFADQDVKLPLRLSEEDVGVILDDDGGDVLTIDSNGVRDDQKVQTIAALVVSAVNDLAGFHLASSRSLY